VYELLATGRYARDWLPEFLIGFAEIFENQGEDAATRWALEELTRSFGPSVNHRIYRLVRIIRLALRFYLRIRGG
jgi:hypothetical protein